MVGHDPVSIVTVTRDELFFSRLLVEKVREFIGARAYEIIVVDRGSKDGTRRWMRTQPDVRLLRYGQWRTRGHGHAEAAEKGIRAARYDRIVLMDSDAHPVSSDWLTHTVDRLSDTCRLAGAKFVDNHKGNPHGWYVHPHYMCFFRSDYGALVTLRKLQGDDTDTGEESTIRMIGAGKDIVACPMQLSRAFDVGNPHVPTVAAGVFHAWYVSRLTHQEAEVIQESGGLVSRARYLLPLRDKLRAAYGLNY